MEYYRIEPFWLIEKKRGWSDISYEVFSDTCYIRIIKMPVGFLNCILQFNCKEAICWTEYNIVIDVDIFIKFAANIL